MRVPEIGAIRKPFDPECGQADHYRDKPETIASPVVATDSVNPADQIAKFMGFGYDNHWKWICRPRPEPAPFTGIRKNIDQSKALVAKFMQDTKNALS